MIGLSYAVAFMKDNLPNILGVKFDLRFFSEKFFMLGNAPPIGEKKSLLDFLLQPATADVPPGSAK